MGWGERLTSERRSDGRKNRGRTIFCAVEKEKISGRQNAFIRKDKTQRWTGAEGVALPRKSENIKKIKQQPLLSGRL